MKKVSTAMTKQGSFFSQPTWTIGLDPGDRNSWHCVLDQDGQIQEPTRPRPAFSWKGDYRKNPVVGAMAILQQLRRNYRFRIADHPGVIAKN